MLVLARWWRAAQRVVAPGVHATMPPMDKTRARAWRLALFGALAGVLFVLAAAGGWWAARRSVAAPTYPLVDEAMALIAKHYLGEVPDELARQRAMIHGLVQGLGDPYSSYVEPAAEELQQDQLAGEYGGVGAFLQRDEAGRVFLVPFDEGPAAEAGIQDGDLLLAVDGVELTPAMSLDQVVALVRGPVGSRVVLALKRQGETFEVALTRQSIEIPSVSWYPLPDRPRIGVVAVARFSQRTPVEVARALDRLQGGGALAVVLDLRGNAGGLLDAAILTADLFLDKGLIVVEVERDGRQTRHEAGNDGRDSESDLPLAVLIDGGTASAAEVVAAALKENGRARLFGQRTYGKGSVQVILPLSDGSSLHLTTARWLTPSGAQLDGAGIEPDTTVAGEGQDPLALAASYLIQGLEAGP